MKKPCCESCVETQKFMLERLVSINEGIERLFRLVTQQPEPEAQPAKVLASWPVIRGGKTE